MLFVLVIRVLGYKTKGLSFILCYLSLSISPLNASFSRDRVIMYVVGIQELFILNYTSKSHVLGVLEVVLLICQYSMCLWINID